MRMIKIDTYKDGGSILVKTDKGTFYQDNAIDSKRKGTWYKAPYERGKQEHEITNPELINNLETMKWHRMRRGNWYGDFEAKTDGRWVRYEDIEEILKEKDEQIKSLQDTIEDLKSEIALLIESASEDQL